ncbi:hypothetical protein C8Q69DRAFT_448914 [Paecilomyces variotii]|uniref:Uncharacterized protein n=1 Tax=Byssochlamys spectabilis TaxID=264951 RepID=A0A443I442_BYSSP|nr:hypothetical protein C8Q69DRAFT_448914 [Paecilomyces variotii]RWQ98848.1 hypothetical protein C8Q69DRAFT_448914 [Paecilomyces variotii]
MAMNDFNWFPFIFFFGWLWAVYFILSNSTTREGLLLFEILPIPSPLPLPLVVHLFSS